MRYHVTHRTVYSYEEMVSICHNETHLQPRDTPAQRCLRTRLDVEPTPVRLTPEQDYFGNPTHFFTVQEPHHRMVLTACSELQILAVESPHPETTEAWETLRARTRADRSPSALAAYEMTFESPRVTSNDEFAAYAAPSFAPGRPALEAALELTHRIYSDFEYRAGATSVVTPVTEVFETRVGVCQDFAHAQLACLRSLGLPARYVSGYIRTRPMEGAAPLIGADASHAWVSLWCGEAGWIDLDPTNDLLVSDQHVTLAWGRDYADVAPIRGVVLGGREHGVHVSVHVEASDEAASPRRR